MNLVSLESLFNHLLDNAKISISPKVDKMYLFDVLGHIIKGFIIFQFFIIVFFSQVAYFDLSSMYLYRNQDRISKQVFVILLAFFFLWWLCVYYRYTYYKKRDISLFHCDHTRKFTWRKHIHITIVSRKVGNFMQTTKSVRLLIAYVNRK